MFDDESDGELVRRISHCLGDTRAAEAELCRRFAGRVRLYGLRHLRSEEPARDLTQAVLLAVLEAVRAGRVEDPDRIDRFVLGTCRHIALRQRRADTRAEPVEEERLDVLSYLPEVERIDVGALLRCLAVLDTRARSVVLMSYQDEKSSDEIARLLEMTPGNVRVVRHRAVAHLRTCLDGGPEVDR
jgi:RNA polymerase sigma-70 factor, ECF subfamily